MFRAVAAKVGSSTASILIVVWFKETDSRSPLKSLEPATDYAQFKCHGPRSGKFFKLESL